MDFNEFKKRYEDIIKELDYEEDKKVYAYISKMLFDDGSESNAEITEDFILNNDDIDFVWTDSKIENNICIVKILKREEILDDNFLARISKMRNYFKNNKEKLIEILDDDNPNINIYYYFINSDDKKIENSNSIEKDFLDSLEYQENESLVLYSFEKLVNNHNKISKKELYIESDEITIDKENNLLKYEGENKLVDKAIICNISAKSLKDLYSKYGDSLLNLNLRFFKKSKSVDDDIKKSIEYGKNFWFLNNGIYIICDSFEINKNKITLNKFSIINGGQTTYNISNTKFENDFFLISKIISINGWNDLDKQINSFEFANQISIASNKQKPISNKDLISNLPESNKLKDSFMRYEPKRENGSIFCETKKGDYSHLPDEQQKMYKKDNVKSVEFFLQLHSCWCDLKPGTAKSGKSKLYINKEKLKDNLKYVSSNVELFTEITFLSNIFKKLQKDLKKNTKKDYENKHLTNFLKYFDFYTISLFRVAHCFLASTKKINSDRNEFFNKLKDLNSLDQLNEFLELKKVGNTFHFKNGLNESQIKSGLKEFANSVSYELISEGLKNKYGDENDTSQCHNLVKADEPLLAISRKMIEILKNNSDLREVLNSILEV